ncbi:MAG: hypothetical protein AAF583_06655 [Pseudomonadota bacterium]
MRTKLLTTAALAGALVAPAFADTTPITANPGDYERPHLEHPDKPDPAVPNVPDFDKPDADLHELFDTLPLDPPEDANGFQQQARVEQVGDDNEATTDQTASEEGLAHIRQDGDSNSADVTQRDRQNNLPLPNPPTTFEVPTNVAIIGQTGDNNDATVDQANTKTGGRGNLADIHQFSAEDTGELDGNTATVVQGDVDDDGLPTDGRVLIARINQGSADAAAENNDASITQDGTFANNVDVRAFVDQQSDGSSATIMQTNVDDAVVTVIQEGFDGATDSESNIANVTQTGGEDLTVELFQNNTGGGFNPGGTENEATILQSGDNNRVSARQEIDDNILDVDQSGSFNMIDTVQSDADGFTSNMIEIDQTGEENVISVLQEDAPSDAFVDQSGSENKVTIQQIASGANVIGGFTNTVDVIQTGHDNDVHVLQQNDGNGAVINQDGSDNDIVLEQRDNSDNGFNDATLTQAAAVSGSTISVLQRDAENSATVNQTAGHNLNVAIDQSGDSSTFAFGSGFFTGDVNVADVLQEGTDNEISIRQEALNVGFIVTVPTANIAALDQGGSNNEVFIEQIGEGNDVGELGDRVVQNGDNLLLEIRQDGAGNGAFGSQTGSFNDLTIDQDGNFNEVNFDQSGVMNVAFVSQDGNANDVTLTQSTDQNAAIIFQDGNLNDATVSQTVQNTQLAVVNQIGNGNTTNISQ